MIDIILKFNFLRRDSRGQTLLEAMIAIGIFGIAIAGVLALISGGQGNSVDSYNVNAALEYGNEGLEAVKAIKNKDWNNLTNGDHGLIYANGEWQFQNSSDTRDIFKRTVTVEAVDDDTKKITSKIEWQTNALRPQVSTTTVLLTNWQPIDTGGLSGDWTRPISAGSVDLGAGNSATDVKVRNKTVYMTAKASSAAKKDFFIIDANSSTSPRIVGSIDTGPGLNAVAISGNYAYVANASGTAQLQIIDISSSTTPTLVKTFKVTQNAGGRGLSIEVASSTVYIGLESSGESEFFIVDVTSPTSPSVLKSIEIGGDVSGVSIFKKRAYLSTPVNSKEFIVIDITNPSTAGETGSYDAPGGQPGRSIMAFNNAHVYFVRDEGSYDELLILNAANASAISILGSKTVSADINDVVVVQNLAFLATDDSNAEFKIYDVSNPSNITSYGQLNFPQVGTGLAYEDNYLYMSVRSNDALRIISSTK